MQAVILVSIHSLLACSSKRFAFGVTLSNDMPFDQWRVCNTITPGCLGLNAGNMRHSFFPDKETNRHETDPNFAWQ